MKKLNFLLIIPILLILYFSQKIQFIHMYIFLFSSNFSFDFSIIEYYFAIQDSQSLQVKDYLFV